jgi:hypothetical protein
MGIMVAVKLTVCPATEGFREETSVTPVPAFVTVTEMAAELPPM